MERSKAVAAVAAAMRKGGGGGVGRGGALFRVDDGWIARYVCCAGCMVRYVRCAAPSWPLAASAEYAGCRRETAVVLAGDFRCCCPCGRFSGASACCAWCASN